MAFIVKNKSTQKKCVSWQLDKKQRKECVTHLIIGLWDSENFFFFVHQTTTASKRRPYRSHFEYELSHQFKFHGGNLEAIFLFNWKLFRCLTNYFRCTYMHIVVTSTGPWCKWKLIKENLKNLGSATFSILLILTKKIILKHSKL